MTPPSVKDYYPSHGSVNIPVDSQITIHFSEKMDTQPTEEAIFVTSIANASGKVSWENESTLIYTFDKKMRPGARYTVTVTSEAQDKAGNKMGRDVIFSFQAGSADLYPVITNTFPVDLAEGISATTNLVIWFSRSMDVASVENNFSISPSVPGSFVWSAGNTVMRYLPYSGWSIGFRYLITIGRDSADLNGLTLADDATLSFLTGASYLLPTVLGLYRYGDTALPINLRYWTNNQSGLEKDCSIAVHFSEPMNRRSAELAFSVSPGKDGWFEWQTAEGETMIFHPDMPFGSGSWITAALDGSASDIDGFAMGRNISLSLHFNGKNSRPLCITNVSDEGIKLSPTGMNDLSIGLAHTNTFTFFFDLTAPDAIDSLSLQDNISISRFAGGGDTSYAGNIIDISYNPDHTAAFLKMGDLATNNYYQVAIKGGLSGTKDVYGNTMKEDFTIIFRAVR